MVEMKDNRRIGHSDEKDKPDKFWTDEALKKKREEPKPKQKISIDGEKVRNGLAQLILTVVELLRELLEKQALRRIESGALTDEQVEKLGMTFMQLKNEVEKMKDYFQLEDEDLNVNLGGLMLRDVPDEFEEGKASAIELLDRLLSKGVVARGDVVISVAEVDLISANLGLLLASVDKARELYAAPSTSELEEEVRLLKLENEKLKKL
jgi:hypothetical protein